MGKRIKYLILYLLIYSSSQLIAGDYLTNTNQSVNFLRNPARYARISVDGIYYNPAGVAFLERGWHLQFNWQQPKQERNSKANYGPLFGANFLSPGIQEADGSFSKKYKGKVNVPIQPSLFVAYNQKDWSFQLGFMIAGGGGTCKFNNGVGSFEALVGQMGMNNLGPLFGGYALNSYLEGKSYYYALYLAVARKLSNSLSISLGVKSTLANNRYLGTIKDIQFRTTGGVVIDAPTQFELDCKQSDIAFSPVLGIDFHPNKYLNLSAKYEFRSKLNLKSKSKNNEAFDLLARDNQSFAAFIDGAKTKGDMPSVLTVAGEVAPIDQLRFNVAYNHYFDVATSQWNKDLLSDTNELGFGVEYEITNRIEVSAGCQYTFYNQTDANVSDLSFNMNALSLGCGIGYKVSDIVKLNAAYFRTDYKRYTKETSNSITTYSRKNRVLGLGVEVSF